ncbi:MAG: gamma-glutamyltransferase family protein, partial [bacterium]|nr:gamma-glutamyltransferase family protein [bacterium]
MKFIRKFLKYLMLLFIILIAGGAIAWLIAPTGPRELLEFDDPYHKKRKAVSAKQYMASTGTPWATQAAVDVLENGGNAFDAAAAALLVLNVTYGEAASFPGVAPLLIYDAKTNTIKGYVGAGTAPEKATIELFKSKGHKTVPKNDMWAQLLPASPDVLISLLKDYGTKSFSELSRPAARIAKEGFPVHKTMLKNLDLNLVERFGFNLLMPYNVDIYLSGQWWRPLHHKERFVRPHLSQTFLDMAQAEKDILRRENSRSRGLTAVRDYFYKGPIADKIVDMHSKENGLFSKKDLANYKGYWEKPVSGSFKEYTIFANNTWCQGPVVPMVLQLLEGIDLKSLGHNSPEYLHTLIQAIELAMADREAFFGDPEFVKVPIKGLLDPGYAAERRKQLTPGKAFGKMPAHGSPSGFQAMNQHIKGYAFNPVSHKNNQLKIGRDTSYICIVDSAGNAVSLTPSDFPQTPMVPGTGLTLGNRMTQFRLDPKHPTALMP